ncbi:MAG: hypothetical protein KAH05_00305 [Clostridiales bacterium]|nr:hypothetical protein [Clostridiales bacterium]
MNYIILLLEKLKEDCIYFALIIKTIDSNSYIDHLLTHKKAKVKNVDKENNSADFYIYQDSSLIILNNIHFDNISEIFALTKKNSLLTSYKDKSFFDFIDIED